MARRVLDGPVLNRTAPCFLSETEGVVSSRGLLLGGRHVVHVSPSLGCRQSRALVGERLGRADSSHRRQRRPFGCATSPYSSTMAPQSVGCPILSQSWCLKLVFFCKNAVRISHPFFGHDFVADYRPSLGFEGAARRVDQIMSPFSATNLRPFLFEIFGAPECFFVRPDGHSALRQKQPDRNQLVTLVR